MKKIITNNAEETFSLAFNIGKKCLGGEVFALLGNLGTGKTKFAQGLAAGLGYDKQVNSPTFNIIKIYHLEGVVKEFCHIDTYRLNSERDILDLGVEEFFTSPYTVSLIEWADKVKKIWPEKTKIVNIRALSPERREIIFS